jgi:cephalosporin hydroxylase
VGRVQAQIKQEPDEFQALLDEIKNIDPVNIILEIGILRGGVICYFRNKVKQVIGIDLGNHPMGLKEYPSDVIIGDSHNISTLEEVKKRLDGKKVDVLFIDGDHSYVGCKSDFEMYSPLVRKGGIVAFHDILLGGWHEDSGKKYGREIRVGKVWNELKPEYNHKELVCGTTWAGIGILYV